MTEPPELVIERARVVVIGGGVLGCSILWELARRGIAGILLEAEPDLCEGTSKANSGIVHTGFDARDGTIEARLLRRSRGLWPEVIDTLGVPFVPVGALMLARTDEEALRLRHEVAANATTMGVEVTLLDGSATRAVAPYLAADVIAALSIPGEAVVDPFWLTRAYAEAALDGGAEIRLGQRVTGLEIGSDAIVVRTSRGDAFLAEQVVDAAGLRADEVARMAGDESFEIRARQGQFLVSEETFGVDRIVLPIPGPTGKGMLVTPIVFGGLLLGPTAVDLSDKGDTRTDPETRARIMAACRAMVPGIQSAAPIRGFAGLRHVSSTGDFIIRPSAVSDRLHLVAGVRSTGISTSPAIGEMVADDIAARRGWRAMAPRRDLRPAEVSFGEAAGSVICLCRSISRAEVEAAAGRPIAPTTLEGLKRRCGATFGDCQGNLCAVDVASVLADVQGIPLTSIEQHRSGSWLWLRTESGPGTPRLAPGRPTRETWDAVIVGGGSAGLAVARSLGPGHLRLVIDRGAPGRTARRTEPAPVDGAVGIEMIAATVVGLERTGIGWRVTADGPNSPIEVTTRTVVLATGGYYTPAERRSIGGPRPAGVITADRAWAILAAGLVPGRIVVLVGVGSEADRLATSLERAGAHVSRLEAEPSEIRGFARLEGILVDGLWIVADTLVLADRLVAQTMLLRGLGLVDGVPGRVAPAGGDGQLPLEGLWAAGCCTRPDASHAGCADSGVAVARSVSTWLDLGTRAAVRVS